MEIEGYSLDELDDVAAALLEYAGDEKIFAFFGEMGVGKSTLIKAICRRLGSEDEVTSPTFSIINEYRDGWGKPLYHFDLYRLKDIGEAMNVGCEDYFYSGCYCFVEWPEIIVPILPETFIKLDLLFKRGRRTIKLKKIKNVRK